MTDDASPAGRAFVERFKEAWAAKDPALLGALFTPDAIVRQPPVSHPFAGAQVARYFEQLLAALPDLELTVQRSAVDGSTIFIEWSIRVTGGDGHPLNVAGTDRFVLDGDLAVDEAVYFDTLPFWAALDPSMKRPGLVDMSA